jgi:DNA-binding CsgD family transcriptional regulator
MNEVTAGNVLERGRDSYAERAWVDAFESLSKADAAALVEPEDLELLAMSAYMLGREDAYLDAFERAHHAHLDAGDVLRAARCAWWIGLNRLIRGETARATGWFGRGERLLERDGRDCVERGYYLIPATLDAVARGDTSAARAAAEQAVAIGERFGDRDLVTMARMELGHVLVREGLAAEGFRLVDETMVAVTTGELSPVVAGIVYCKTIAYCQDALEARRAREWTLALSGWCERQPDLVAFTGLCLVHRAEVLQLQGAWPAALDEAQRAGERFRRGGPTSERYAGGALYRAGEVYRLRGDFAAAEEAYRGASRAGVEPQPGLALLRLAQGNGEAARAAIQRVLDETREPLERAGLLPAFVEVMLAVGDLETARRGSEELSALAAAHEIDVLGALAGQTSGAVALAQGDARGALGELRHALSTWQELEAPYETARTRVLVGLACTGLGDEEAGGLELDAARAVLEELGAGPDLERLGSLARSATADDVHGLSTRERQVLQLLAAGETNRAIAAELVLSERTIERHVSNIFAKLGVSSRAGATAFAYEHRLL